MALVNVTNVVVLDNPTAFTNPFQFDITFECLQELQDDLEWKITYVGCAEDPSKDQVLEEVMVGPVLVGVNRFVLQAPAPNYNLIALEDLIGVTVILVSCLYMDQEFVTIGYYVNNEYSGYDSENPPTQIDISLLYRNILAENPKVTRNGIDWSGTGDPNAVLNLDEYDRDNAQYASIVLNEDSMDVDQMQYPIGGGHVPALM